MTKCELSFLVVDDDDLLRLATKNMLRSLNASRVLEASDGIRALEILREESANPIEVILCDLNMPGMDGMEFLRHLGEAHSSVAVIIMSAHDDALISTVKKMALAYGVNLLCSMQKPLSLPPLEACLLLHESILCKAKTAAQASPAGVPEHYSLDEILRGLREGQFEPFFQPKVSFKTALVCGGEALARWIHPRHGVIPPYAFIEPLEKSGNIAELTFSILGKTAAACHLLHDNGHAMPVSVNLSVDLLSDPSLADKILQLVRNAGVDPRHIILEITETAIMTDVAHSLENLARLRMHGFGLSIDDYGTGASNVQQITRIASGELKIDRSLVNGCAASKDLAVIVRSSVEMAHKLGMKCVAEGVETRQDWDVLKGMGCDMAQGYLIAKPMNLPSFLDFCSAHSPETLL